MSKNIVINVELKDNSKVLFSKKKSILDCQLDVPTLDPTKLNPFDESNNKIYQIEVKPVVNRVDVYDDGSTKVDTGISGLNQVGVVSVKVKSVAETTVGGETIARINGGIDMPIKGYQKRTTLENAWFTDQDTANAICMAAAEIELEKAEKMKEEVDGAVSVLKKIAEVYGSSEVRSSKSSKKQYKVEIEGATTSEEVANAMEDAAQAIRDAEE